MSDLIRLKVDLVVATSSFAVEAARKATGKIPIIMTGVGNPVKSGFVVSLARPGGNITGLTSVSVEISSKYLELLRSAVPKMSRVGVLIDPLHPNHPTVLQQISAGAKNYGISVIQIRVDGIENVEAALAVAVHQRVDALIVPPDPTWTVKMRKIADFAATNYLPTMFGLVAAVEAGGLMSYQANSSEMYRRAAAMADKILMGASPSNMPVEIPTRYEFTINAKTAEKLKIKISNELMIRADRIIE